MEIVKRISVLLLTAILSLGCFSATAFAATTVGYNAAAITNSANYANYEDNAPINRVFRVKSGNSSASRTLKFNQTEGEIGYYMYRNTTKSCMQKYRIFVYNDDTRKSEGTYYWNWSKGTTVRLSQKNTNYIVVVYPEDFDVVVNKYLTTKILNLRPIISGYTKSPHFTISTAAKISYSEKDSIKLAGV